MGKLLGADIRLNEMSPLTLSFIGDSVYELFVREYIVGQGNCSVNKLHSKTVEYVRCEAQAYAAKEIMPVLTQEEEDIFKRGRNARVAHVPKNADRGDYHMATGLEALFGYLYLKGNTERLLELFEMIIEGEENKNI